MTGGKQCEREQFTGEQAVDLQQPEADPRAIALQLRSHMQPLGITSFRALAQAAGVSEWQVRQLRQGKLDNMRWVHLKHIAQALQIQPAELLGWAEAKTSDPYQPQASQPQASSSEPSHQSAASGASKTDAAKTDAAKTQGDGGRIASPQALQQECDRLQQQLEQQQQTLLQEFQRTSLYTLEAWMKNWPKVVHVVRTQNPDLPAAKILALVSPVSQLLQHWNVETIGAIGETTPYDPTCQTLVGHAQPGDLVEVTRPGYRHGPALLHRAEVKS